MSGGIKSETIKTNSRSADGDPVLHLLGAGGLQMNRRSFLKAATGCAVAAPVAVAAYKNEAMGLWLSMDLSAGGYQSCVLWAVDRTTGKWREVDFEQFMGDMP